MPAHPLIISGSCSRSAFVAVIGGLCAAVALACFPAIAIGADGADGANKPSASRPMAVGIGLAELETQLNAQLAHPRALTRASHRSLLVRCANAGSATAAARLCSLGWFDAMRRVEVEAPVLAAWSGSCAMVAGWRVDRLRDELWINRVEALPGLGAEMRADEQLAAAEDLLTDEDVHPAALLDAAYVLSTVGEDGVARARVLAQRAATRLLSDGFSGDDLLLVEGRGALLIDCQDYLEHADWTGIEAAFAAEALARSTRSDVVGEGLATSLGAHVALRAGADARARGMMERAAALFARAGDHARRGRCLHALGEWCQPSIEAPGDRGRAIRLFREAAACCQRDQDWEGAGASLSALGWCLYPDIPDPAVNGGAIEPELPDDVDWGLAAATFAAAAGAHGLDGDVEAQARDYHCQGLCLDPMFNTMGSPLFSIPVFLAAESCFASTADVSTRAWNLCVLGEARRDSGDRDGARESLHAAAELALQEAEEDLLARIGDDLSAIADPAPAATARTHPRAGSDAEPQDAQLKSRR